MTGLNEFVFLKYLIAYLIKDTTWSALNFPPHEHETFALNHEGPPNAELSLTNVPIKCYP